MVDKARLVIETLSLLYDFVLDYYCQKILKCK